VVLSPGSRCAPLTVAFARHPQFKIDVISDERSAAFVALGKSIQTQQPTVLICTSGSALYNYAPAIVEAFYQKIPLIILSADRPKEWIGQNDGQTMVQNEVFGKHVLKSIELSVEHNHPESLWMTQRLVDEAVEMANTGGPVHINIPIREPFYESLHHTYDTSKVFARQLSKGIGHLNEEELKTLNQSLAKHSKILIVAGQQRYDISTRSILENIHAPIISDCISNLHGLKNAITTHDALLSTLNDEEKNELAPTLVIRFGEALLSKPLKQWLRNLAAEHWVIQEHGAIADVFKSTHRVIRANVLNILPLLEINNHSYLKTWQQLQQNYRTKIDTLLPNNTQWAELPLLKQCLSHAPINSVLHLSNSMSVRYANYLNLDTFNAIHANRGVSGIDGVVSTTIGYASKSDLLNILIVGDQAFFYDRNAFWNGINKKNVKIILLNNQAGSIFRMIDGPASLPELEKYFEAPHQLTAAHLAKEFNLNYYLVTNLDELNKNLSSFFNDNAQCSILEIKTESASNVQAFKHFKAQL
jgi:2-succinyl-5-enolpyruvyl-6-hydroxy-3-cyclohexene-1-carboxylate synthase